MKILFFCDHPIIATDGGISRITDSLVHVFRNYGHKVFILSAKKWENANVDKLHFYLPNDKYDEECLNYMVGFYRDNEIDFIVNQSATNKQVISFFECVKARCPIKVLSCIHNCTSGNPRHTG